MTSIIPSPPGKERVPRALLSDLRRFWDDQVEDWDTAVGVPKDPSSDLWDTLPKLDSKTIMKASPIFRRHLGVELEVKDLRAGGHKTFEDFVNTVVPRVMKRVLSSAA